MVRVIYKHRYQLFQLIQRCSKSLASVQVYERVVSFTVMSSHWNSVILGYPAVEVKGESSWSYDGMMSAEPGVGGWSGPQTRSSALFSVVSETVGYSYQTLLHQQWHMSLPSNFVPISIVPNVQKHQRSLYGIGLVSSLCQYREKCLSLHQSPRLTAIQSSSNLSSIVRRCLVEVYERNCHHTETLFYSWVSGCRSGRHRCLQARAYPGIARVILNHVYSYHEDQMQRHMVTSI